jgi:hypothetical protein
LQANEENHQEKVMDQKGMITPKEVEIPPGNVFWSF